MIDVSNKVRDNRIDKASKEYEVSVKPYNFNIFNFKWKIGGKLLWKEIIKIN